MRRTLDIAPRALTEASAVSDWYEQRRPGYGRLFRHKFDELLDRIVVHPEAYEAINARYRRAFVHRFPILAVYRVWSDRIEIVGVRPTRADPALLALLVRRF